MGVITERLKGLKNPRVRLYYMGRKYEGLVLSFDDNFLELHDTIGDFRRFYKIELIESLEVVS